MRGMKSFCGWGSLLIMLASFANCKRSKDSTDVVLDEDLVHSCAFSIHLDLEGQNCADYCAQSLGHPNYGDVGWAFKVLEPPEIRMSNCAIPAGQIVRPVPESTSYFVRMNRMVDNWVYSQNKDVKISETQVQRTMSTTQLYNVTALKTILDPFRLTYAGIRQSSRLNQKDQCTYLHTTRPMEKDVLEKLPSDFFIYGDSKYHGTTTGIFCPSHRHPKVAMDFFKEDVEEALDEDGTYEYWPIITPWVQQHYLRYGYTNDLYLTVTRSYDTNAKSILQDRYKIDTEYSVDQTATYSDTLFELEAMTSYTYDTTVAPDCAERLDCSSCTVSGTCAWCDLSRVPMSLQAHWHSKTGASLEDGSVCGLPPQVCAMMGGLPVVDYCRARVLA